MKIEKGVKREAGKLADCEEKRTAEAMVSGDSVFFGLDQYGASRLLESYIRAGGASVSHKAQKDASGEHSGYRVWKA